MAQWETEVLRAFTSTASHVPVFKRRGAGRSGRGPSQTSPESPWPEQACRKAGHSCWCRHQAETAQTHPDTSNTGKDHLCLEKVKSTKCKVQAAQQQPQFGTGKVTENTTWGNFWFSRPKQAFFVWILCSALSTGWTRRHHEVPSNLSDSMILHFLQRQRVKQVFIVFCFRESLGNGRKL